MLDVLFLAEWVWVWVHLSRKPYTHGLRVTAGVLVAGYTATNVSNWLIRWLAPPASPALNWLTSHVNLGVASVEGIGSFMPPVVTTAHQLNTEQWVAIHIANVFFGVGVTLAVFALFIVGNLLVVALWDADLYAGTARHKIWAMVLAACTATYVTMQSGLLLANLSWLKPLQLFAQVGSQSVWLRLVGHLMGGVL